MTRSIWSFWNDNQSKQIKQNVWMFFPFPHIDTFLLLYCRQLLKIWLQKEKLFINSNFPIWQQCVQPYLIMKLIFYGDFFHVFANMSRIVCCTFVVCGKRSRKNFQYFGCGVLSTKIVIVQNNAQNDKKNMLGQFVNST